MDAKSPKIVETSVLAFIERECQSRLDFMAVLLGSAASSERESGVLAGVARTRITRQSRAEPPVREHRRSGVTKE